MHEEISSGVFLIDTLAVRVPGMVASYLIRGEKSALVDTGYATSADSVLSELKTINPRSWQVDYLIATHVHPDHAGGLGHLAKAMPGARVLVSKHGARHLVDPTRLTQSATVVFGDESMSLFGSPVPVSADRIERVDDSCSLDLGGGKRLRIFWTPGHAWHHISIFLDSERLLFTGDAVGLRYTGYDTPIPSTPPPAFDPDQYMKTIAGFIEMNPSALLLPHYGLVRDNIREFLESNREIVEDWKSQALETVRVGGSSDRLFDMFMTDIATRTGKSRDMIAEHVARSIMISAKGLHKYAVHSLQMTGSREMRPSA